MSSVQNALYVVKLQGKPRKSRFENAKIREIFLSEWRAAIYVNQNSIAHQPLAIVSGSAALLSYKEKPH